MKKIFLLILIFISAKVFGQFPIEQSLGSPKSQVYSKGAFGVDSGFIYRSCFTDTIQANRGFIKNIPGMKIRTCDDNIWMRNNTATKWILIGGVSSFIGVDSVTKNTAGDSFYVWKGGIKTVLADRSITAGNGLTDSSGRMLWGGNLYKDMNLDGNGFNINFNNSNIALNSDGGTISASGLTNNGIGRIGDNITSGGYLQLNNLSGIGGFIYSTNLTGQRNYQLPNTGNTNDTIATLHDIRAGVSGSTGSNLSYNSGTHSVDIDGGGTSAVVPLANTTTTGLITTTDWNTFNNKQSTITNLADTLKYLKKSDSAAMLFPYLKKIDKQDSLSYHSITQITDSSFTLNRPNGTKDTVQMNFTGGAIDSVLMASVKRLKDSMAVAKALTATHIAFGGANGRISSSSNLTWDGTNIITPGIGIGGTPTAGTPLHIKGNSTALPSAIKIENLGATGTYPFFQMLQAGSASGVTDWNNASVIEGAAGGGLIFGAYTSGANINFQVDGRNSIFRITGTTHNVNIQSKLYIGNISTVPSQLLDVGGNIAFSSGTLIPDKTITTAGTTGAQTINKPAGTVNFAAGASTLVVTNSLVTASSLVFAVIRTNDATAIIKNVVPAAGSFTITLNAAAGAETSVGFFVVN